MSVQTIKAVGGGFSGANVFRAATSDGQDLAVRRTERSIALSPERLWRLYSLLRQVSQSGYDIIPVPFLPINETFLPHRDQVRSEVPWVEDAGFIWQIEPWMPGSSTEGRDLTSGQQRHGLQALAQFHQSATRAVDTLGPDHWFHNAVKPSPSVQRRLRIATELTNGELDILRRHLSQDCDERFRGLAIQVCEALRPRLPWLYHELSALSLNTFSVQPVLRDVWRAHVLFTKDRVTGLIDLSAAASDHVTVDVTRLVRSWFGSNGSQVQNAYSQFQSLRILNAAELRLMHALDASTVLLSPVTWLRRRMHSGASGNVPEEVIMRLRELAEVAEKFTPVFER